MAETLSFTHEYNYDTLKIGITIPVTLIIGADAVDLEAKVDTGAENCVFERIHGERLGLVIESGEKQTFSTAVGKFVGYAHDVTLRVLDLEFFTRVYFAESEYFTRNVLGRQGWLDRVKMGLIDHEGKLLLGRYEK